jgi:hypothetical protein
MPAIRLLSDADIGVNVAAPGGAGSRQLPAWTFGSSGNAGEFGTDQTTIGATATIQFNAFDIGGTDKTASLFPPPGTMLTMVDSAGKTCSFVVGSGINVTFLSGSGNWAGVYCVSYSPRTFPYSGLDNPPSIGGAAIYGVTSGFFAPGSAGDKEQVIADYSAVDFSALDIGNIGLNALSTQVAALTKMQQAQTTAFRAGTVPGT